MENDNIISGSIFVKDVVGGASQSRTDGNVKSALQQHVSEVIKNKLKIRDNECAPTVGQQVCSSSGNLDVMRDWLNLTNASDLQVIEAARKAVGCESESCLYTKRSELHKLLNQQDLESRFAPLGPWDNTRWLSNDDIDLVLHQWTQKFPHFHHVPFQMADFHKQNGELACVDYSKVLAKGAKLQGCVVNTDYSGGPGQHWVSTVVDFENGTVEYFDSAGQDPMQEFLEWMVRTSVLLSKLTGRQFKDIEVTKMVHQKKDTECGVYSLFYVLSRLNGVPYKFFEHNRVADEDMQAFRRFVFRKS